MEKRYKLTPEDLLTVDVESILPKLLKSNIARKILHDCIKELITWPGDHMIDDLSLSRGEIQKLLAITKSPSSAKNADPILVRNALVLYIDTVMKDWKEVSTQKTANQMVASLPLFVEMSKVLPHINPADKYKVAFRGTELNDTKIKSFIANTKPHHWSKINKMRDRSWMMYTGPQKNNFTYKPHREVQSWSVSREAATGFGSSVVVTRIDSSFFFDPDFSSQYGWPSDRETTHFGKTPMKVALLITRDDFMYFKPSTWVTKSKNSLKYESDGPVSESIEIQDEEGTLVIPSI